MVGELGRGDRHAADLTTPFQFATERRVQTVALAVEQLLVGHLGQEGVAEGITAEPAGDPIGVDQDPLADRRPQRVRDRLGRHLEHRRQQRLVDPTAGG